MFCEVLAIDENARVLIPVDGHYMFVSDLKMREAGLQLLCSGALGELLWLVTTFV